MAAAESPLANFSVASSFEQQCASETPFYEAALLIDLASGGVSMPAPGADWAVLGSLAKENGVLAHVYRALLQSGAEIPESFAQAAREENAAATSLAEELCTLLALFAQHAIDVLPLKGPALSLLLYGDAGMRFSHDLDLLVRREDFSRAEALLLCQGFAPSGPMDGYHRQFLRGGLSVELHFGLSDPRYFPMDTEAVWTRARAGEFLGIPAYAMCREDLALYLCCHAGKHGFSRLIWTLDFVQSLRDFRDSEYESLLKLAQRRDLAPWLFSACAVLRAVFPNLLPPALDALLYSFPTLNQRAERAAARMFSGALESGVNNYRALYLQIEPNPWKRLRYSARYFDVSLPDHQWARRHHVPIGLMRLLRPFRLLEKYGVRKTFHTFFPQG